MSIWVNREHIGTDDRVRGYEPNNRGVVLSYVEGFSNHYPEPGLDFEAPSSVMVSTIPTWCVPGHGGEEDLDASGPWLRLDLYGHDHDEHGKATGSRKSAALVLDLEAARALAEDLLAWVDGRHVDPRSPS